MKLIRYKNAIAVETHGGVVRTLLDVVIASRMARGYMHDACTHFEKHGSMPAYYVSMAATWREFAAQLFVRWVTFGLGGKDRILFIEKGAHHG